MLRLTETRGSRVCPAAFQASRYASICFRCWTCSGSPLSSYFSVELWRFMPRVGGPLRGGVRAGAPPDAIAQALGVRLEAKQPGWIREHRPRIRLREPLPFDHLEEHLGMASCHVGVALAVGGRIAEVPPAVDHLLRRAPADPELQAATRDEVGRARVLRHVQRVLVAHVDHGRADLDRARACADGRQQRERRAELAREMMDAEVRAVRAQLLGGDSEFERLEQRIRRRAHLRAVRVTPVSEREKSDALHRNHALPHDPLAGSCVLTHVVAHVEDSSTSTSRIFTSVRCWRSDSLDSGRAPVVIRRSSCARSRAPAGVRWRTLTRRSSADGWRRTSPAASSRSTSPVTFDASHDERVGEPAHRQRPARLDQVQHVALDRREVEFAADVGRCSRCAKKNCTSSCQARHASPLG